MRRPAPLPASPEQESAPAQPPLPLRGRRETSPPAGDADETAPIDPIDPVGGVPEAEDGQGAEVTSGDVWRAARARRKALRAEIRRFTQRSRRRRIIWLSSIGVAVLVLLGSVLVAYSPLFAVEKITVAGTKALDAKEVEKALAGQLGTPLALVDQSAVKAALVKFPLIETYALEARPPHDLTVRIVERTPIGVIKSDAGYTLVDAAGVALSTTSAQPAGQPLLDIGAAPGSAVFENAGLVVRSLPADVRARLTGVRASTPDDVTLTLDGKVAIVWGSAEKSAEKALALTRVMKAKPDARSYDVSSPAVPLAG
ncbi:FtsQ-type POTRA domain-containing protein [Microbacterium sp.]|uniref:FtsQ-type POTRA domain-containing protein n=1 Tax=Microbacterium sp. TaxID=51671 RepID=UPI00333E60AB